MVCVLVQGRSFDFDLVRDVGIELPANEKISKRDVVATLEHEDPEILPLFYSPPESNGEVKINKEREKRFLVFDTNFPVDNILGSSNGLLVNLTYKKIIIEVF
ncbi:hypothetical protein ABEB36_002340 [Hypothenemus hampei]|uniref:Uncharacterized protein n=1 Tax=Hypothenemus hampei TaxID=57062 RepID=A0ABD1F5D9_HYPHA